MLELCIYYTATYKRLFLVKQRSSLELWVLHLTVPPDPKALYFCVDIFNVHVTNKIIRALAK